jgi:enoyl-CoA hydratase
MELLDDVITTIRRLHQPVIAAINGPAIGGGLLPRPVGGHPDRGGLRLLPGRRHQQRPDGGRAWGSASSCPRSVGQSRASEIMLTGRDVSAEEADRIGLVASVVPGDALSACYETAARIIGWSRPGIELTKRQLWNSLDASSLQTHMDAEGTAQLFVRITTQNFQESIRARREKRSPVFLD